MQRNIIPLFILLFASTLIVSCSLSGKALEGRVVEEGTLKPIVGAIVVARWQAHLAGIADGKTVCYHVLSTTTDDKGRYHFPAWKKPAKETWQKHLSEEEVLITVYKSGYQWPDKVIDKDNEYFLTPAKGTSSERLAYLSRVAVSCSDKKEIEINLLPLYEALYKEAKNIAVTSEDKNTVETLLFGLESLKFDSVTALKRMTERRESEK